MEPTYRWPHSMDDEAAAIWLLWEQTDEDRAEIRSALGGCPSKTCGEVTRMDRTPALIQAPVVDEAHLASQFPRSCSCCGVVFFSAAAWRALPFKGHQIDPTGLVAPLEYRDCTCRSTLAVQLQPEAA